MLTDTEIKRTIKSATTETTLNDGSAGRGSGSLRLRIRPTGDGATATWLGWWKVNGKRQSKPLGKYPDVSLSQARQIFAAEISPLVRAGKNPLLAPVAAGKPTVERMFQGYVASLRAQNKASADETERMLLTAKENAADSLGRHRIAATVDESDVANYVSKFFARGKRGAADKGRAYISAAFGWAKKAAHDYTATSRQNWGIKTNPATDVRKDAGAVTQRDRNLDASEMKALWAAAVAGGKHFTLETAGCVRLLMCTGQRVEETLRVHGSEIELDAAVWNVPKEKTKGKKRPHTVALTPYAVDVLRALIAVHGDGPLFPSRKGSKSPYIVHRSIMQAIERWFLATGDTPFQTRDLRRTWKSRAGDAGIDRFTRDLIQQHAKHDTGSKSYDRTDYLPAMRVAMATWHKWMENNIIAKEFTQLDSIAA